MSIVGDSANAIVGAAGDFKNRLLNPFQPKITPQEVKDAHAKNDFKAGLIINEFVNGKFDPTRKDDITLNGDMMPHVPFTYGGQQKIVRDYYPGNSEPTMQILGPRESDLTIKGRLYAKHIKAPPIRTGVNLGGLGNLAAGAIGSIPGVPDISPGIDQNAKKNREKLRSFPREMAQLMDAMRIRGNLVRLTMGEYQRFGFIEETIFSMRTIADIDYEIRFSIIGFNPPADCKIIGQAKTVPFDINKDLIAEANKYRRQGNAVPPSMPRSLGDLIRDGINDVAETVNLVTGFVDTVLDQVDDTKSAVSRALGLIKHSRNEVRNFSRRIGGVSSFAEYDIAAGGGISSGYANAAYLKSVNTSNFSLTALLASLEEQIANISATEPLGRHRIQEGDTLQKIAMRFYDDAAQWKQIFDHNLLQDTDLSDQLGEILEIPRLS
jgi:hypothetical protein